MKSSQWLPVQSGDWREGIGERSSLLAESHCQLPPSPDAERPYRGLQFPGHRGRGPQQSRFLLERKETSWFGHYG